MRADRIAAAALGAVMLSSSALAAPKLGEIVSVTACARSGVEGSCLMSTVLAAF